MFPIIKILKAIKALTKEWEDGDIHQEDVHCKHALIERGDVHNL